MSEQKTLNPQIEDIINEVLISEIRENALNFVAFLHANEFQMEFNPNEYEEGKWTGAIGGVVGDSIAYMLIHPGTESLSPWVIWLNEYDFDCDCSPSDEELKEFIRNNLNQCGKCHSDWEKCRGGEKTVFGKEFNSLCHSPIYFAVPDAQKLGKLKQLLLKIKRNRNDVQHN